MKNAHFTQRKINPRREKRRSKRNQNNLQQEPVEAEGIIMQHDPACIPDHFGNQPARHDEHESPCFVSYPEEEVS